MLTSFQTPERKDRANDGYGGVMVYVKDNITYSRRQDLELLGIENIWIDVSTNNRHVLIDTFYRVNLC